MSLYYYQQQTTGSFETVEKLLRDALKEQGFGIITEIDVKKTMREKLNIDHEPYMILGACNPGYAHKAMELEKNIGVLLPCNVVIRSEGNRTIVSAILPTMQSGKVGNNELLTLANKVELALKLAVDNAIKRSH